MVLESESANSQMGLPGGLQPMFHSAHMWALAAALDQELTSDKAEAVYKLGYSST